MSIVWVMNEQGSYFQHMGSHKCLHTVIMPGNRQWDYNGISLQFFHKIISFDSVYKKGLVILFQITPSLLSPAFPRSMKTGLLQLLHVLPAAAFFLKKFEFIWHIRKAETLLFNSLFLNFLCVMRCLKQLLSHKRGTTQKWIFSSENSNTGTTQLSMSYTRCTYLVIIKNMELYTEHSRKTSLSYS